MAVLENITLADRYFLRKLAGQGGMAQVYQAWDRLRSTDMAIKVIHDIRFFESFVREAGALKDLAHPNIVRFYSVEKDEKNKIVFIVMDWVEGKDLQSILKKRGGPLGVGEVTHILDSLQKALSYAHKQGVCHCDIKPGNILLKNSDNQVLLSDFGLAHIAHDKGMGGTLPFMAPELFKGGSYSVSSDIYALGVTLYQLLSNKLPFYSETREQLIQEHLTKAPPQIQNFNPKLPNGIVSVIERALEKDPNKRQRSVTELWEEFSKYSRGRQDEAPINSPILFGIKGERTGQKIKISIQGITIGRSKANALRLNHSSVSRYHAIVVWQQGGFFIRDNGSSVGTYLNGRRLQSNRKEKLRNSDRIKLGVNDVFEFRFVSASVGAGNELLAEKVNVPEVSATESLEIGDETNGFDNKDTGLIKNEQLAEFVTDLSVASSDNEAKVDNENRKEQLPVKREQITDLATGESTADLDKGRKIEGEDDVFSPSAESDMIIPIKKSISVNAYKDIFIGRDKDFKQFSTRLLNSTGGTFCVAGFSGVGKSTFVNKAIKNLRSNIEQNNKEMLLVVKVVIPARSFTSDQLINSLIRELSNQIDSLGITNSLNKKLMETINLASARISGTIKKQGFVNNSISGNIGVEGGMLAGLNTTKTSQSGQEYSYLEYTVADAESDLRLSLQGLNNQIIRARWLQKKRIRVLCVIDKLDNIKNFESLDKLLSSLKTLFIETGTSVIFIVGNDLYTHWKFNQNQDLSEIVSDLCVYLPCLWGVAGYALSEMTDLGITRTQDDLDDTKIIFEDFVKYVSYKIRGIPDKLRHLEDFTLPSDDGQSTNFVFSPEEIRRFRFFAGLYEWIEKIIGHYKPKRFDGSIADDDFFKKGFYDLIDKIRFLGNDWFTARNLIDEIRKSTNWMLRYLSEDDLQNLLNDLRNEEYLMLSGDHYKLHDRRYHEIGSGDINLVTVQDTFQPPVVSGKQEFNDGVVDRFRTVYADPLFDDIYSPGNTRGCHVVLENIRGTLFAKVDMDQSNKMYFMRSIMFEEKLDIGRAPESDLQINDLEVSHYHCRLIRVDKNWQIIDMNPANKTYVNGKPLRQNQELITGDVISIRNIKILFSAKDS